ncbi:MAG: methyltransferase domain-containing protein [Bacteriovoracaceae bacterium]
MEYKKASWHFNRENAGKFDDHVMRSIPWYHEGHELVLKFSEFFVKQDDVIYDLGCATGRLSTALAEYHNDKNVTVIGLDESKDMIIEARKRDGAENVTFINENILTHAYKPTNLMIAYYTVQFMAEAKRKEMLKKTFKHLNTGGAFLLFEKTRAETAVIDNMFSTLLTEFKLEQGQSADEIVAKLLSLKGVLEPSYSEEIVKMLKTVGFRHVERIFKLNSFEGFLAIK